MQQKMSRCFKHILVKFHFKVYLFQLVALSSLEPQLFHHYVKSITVCGVVKVHSAEQVVGQTLQKVHRTVVRC